MPESRQGPQARLPLTPALRISGPMKDDRQVRAKGALSIGRAWEEARAALVAHRRVVLPLLLGLVLIPSVVMAMVEPRTSDVVAKPNVWMTLVTLVGLLSLLVAQLTVILIVNGWRGSLGAAIGRGCRRAPVYAGGLLLIAVALALVSLLALSGTPMAVDSAGNPDLTRLTPYARIIFSLAGIALIFLSVRFLPLAAVVVEENSGVIQSMRRSFALTRGHFFRLLAFLVVTGIVIIVASRAVIVVVGSVAQLLLGKAEPWSLSLLVTAFAAGAMQMVLTAIYASMIARLSAQLGADSRQR